MELDLRLGMDRVSFRGTRSHSFNSSHSFPPTHTLFLSLQMRPFALDGPRASAGRICNLDEETSYPLPLCYVGALEGILTCTRKSIPSKACRVVNSLPHHLGIIMSGIVGFLDPEAQAPSS